MYGEFLYSYGNESHPLDTKFGHAMKYMREHVMKTEETYLSYMQMLESGNGDYKEKFP